MWNHPSSISDTLISFSKKLNAEWIGAVSLEYFSEYNYNNCHNNVLDHIEIYGGTRRVCYYMLEANGLYQAIYHSVWQDEHGKLLDITPHADGRDYNIIALLPEESEPSYSVSNCYSSIVDLYLNIDGKCCEEYYVYSLDDPETNKPFYIGKGIGDRAKHHLLNLSKSSNVYKQNKIDYIRKKGLEPRISYLCVNIREEKLAYDIEEMYILFYGRKGYESNGVLTNVCLGAQPPNHKGKTYEEIYGKKKAQEQKSMRSKLQKQRGGYGPKQFTKETKEYLSLINSGSGNPRYGAKVAGTETAEKISKANKGKKHYGRLDIKLFYIDGLDMYLYSNDLKSFCNEYNLSEGTFRSQYSKNWPRSKRGKNKGLLMTEADKSKDSGLNIYNPGKVTQIT